LGGDCGEGTRPDNAEKKGVVGKFEGGGIWGGTIAALVTPLDTLEEI